MRRTALLLVVMAAVAGVCLAGDNPVIGTWEAVSSAPDGTTSELNERSIKIYGETHFAVVGHNADGTFSFAFAGEYVVKGNTVAEKVQMGSDPELVGYEVAHKFSISGDDWESTWIAPDGATFKEVWKRVK